MFFYPEKISERFLHPRFAGKSERANAIGAGAAFVCGSYVRFFLEIDAREKTIRAAQFKTNGCGYAIAAADWLCEKIVGRNLKELHGLGDLRASLEKNFGRFDASRAHCAEICFDAIARALGDFRLRSIEEFAGEKALICTCFGVSEEAVERAIDAAGAETVEEIGALTNAGTGCGSCQFLIGAMLDAKL